MPSLTVRCGRHFKLKMLWQPSEKSSRESASKLTRECTLNALASEVGWSLQADANLWRYNMKCMEFKVNHWPACLWSDGQEVIKCFGLFLGRIKSLFILPDRNPAHNAVQHGQQLTKRNWAAQVVKTGAEESKWSAGGHSGGTHVSILRKASVAAWKRGRWGFLRAEWRAHSIWWATADGKRRPWRCLTCTF